MKLPGVCRRCRARVWWDGIWWKNDKGIPHACKRPYNDKA